MCLSCGCDTHIRADGACMQHGCPAKVTSWDAPASVVEQKKAPIVLPFDDSEKEPA